MQCCHLADFACTLVGPVISVANCNIHFTMDVPIIYCDCIFNRWQKKVTTDFSGIPNCPNCKHGKCMNCKVCSSMEFLIHQMTPSVTLAASYI